MYIYYLFLVYATNIVFSSCGVKQEKITISEKIPENKTLSHFDILLELFWTLFKNVDLKLSC